MLLIKYHVKPHDRQPSLLLQFLLLYLQPCLFFAFYHKVLCSTSIKKLIHITRYSKPNVTITKFDI